MMARLLVTRPRRDAKRTAEEIRARGHVALIAPLREVVALDAPMPDAAFDFLIASSANAFRYGAPLPARLHAAPLYAIGPQTALAASEAGFADIRAGEGSAPALIAAILADQRQGARGLYLAGLPRRREIETRLEAAGYRLDRLPRYRMATVAVLPHSAVEALRAGTCDAVLHFSAESAAAFFALAAKAGLTEAALGLRHACLSAAVAARIHAIAGPAPLPALAIAAAPSPAALIDAALNARSKNTQKG